MSDNTPRERVLELLRQRSAGDGWQVSDSVIARELGVSRMTVSRTVRELEAAGVIRIERHGPRWPNTYFVPEAVA